MKSNKTTKAVVAMATSISCVYGAGFQLSERSTSGLGRGFSAEAAIADDASVLASNPAAMILLDDNAISAGITFINPQADVSGTALTPPPGGPQPTRSEDVGEHAVVPHFYLSKKLNDRVSYGVGSFTTYGLKTNYDSSFLGLGLADESELVSANFNAAIAYRANERWSFGFGLNALYAEGTLSASQPITGATAALIEGDDIGFGWNVGALYEHSERTRFGLHYRSRVDLTLEGDTTIPGFMIAGLDTTLAVSLPETIELSAYHGLNDRWAIHGDVVWTNWNRYRGIQTQTAIPAANISEPTQWRDTLRYSAGATYQYCDKLTLRGGLVYDVSPVAESDRRLRIPDNDRVWVTFGFSYQLTEKYTLDFGYAHLFIDDAAISDAAPMRGAFTGNASGDVDIFSLGFSDTF